MMLAMTIRTVLKRKVPNSAMSLGAIKLVIVQQSAATNPDNSINDIVICVLIFSADELAILRGSR